MQLVRSESEGLDGLDVAAERLYRFGFDRVALPHRTLGYEPRSSDKCGDCAALWVGSKSGLIMRIDLRTESGGAQQRFLPGDREARAIKHVHASKALSRVGLASPSSFLLVGRDDGVLEIVHEADGFDEGPPRQLTDTPRRGFHLSSWARSPTVSPVAVDGHVPCKGHMTIDELHTVGITAIETLSDPEHKAAIWILVATRSPALYLMRAEGGEISLRGTMAMPGWIDWIVSPDDKRKDILCVSRGGDIVRIKPAMLADAMRADAQPGMLLEMPPPQSLALHPTAVLPFEADS